MSRKEGKAWYSMRTMPFLRMAFSPSVIGLFAPPLGLSGLLRDLSTSRELVPAGFLLPGKYTKKNFKYMKYFLLVSSTRIYSFVKHAIWNLSV
jgi:hypothetical protein